MKNTVIPWRTFQMLFKRVFTGRRVSVFFNGVGLYSKQGILGYEISDELKLGIGVIHNKISLSTCLQRVGDRRQVGNPTSVW